MANPRIQWEVDNSQLVDTIDLLVQIGQLPQTIADKVKAMQASFQAQKVAIDNTAEAVDNVHSHLQETATSVADLDKKVKMAFSKEKIQEAGAEVEKLADHYKKVSTEVKAAEGSLNALRTKQKELVAEMNNLDMGSKEYKKLQTELINVNSELKEHQLQMRTLAKAGATTGNTIGMVTKATSALAMGWSEASEMISKYSGADEDQQKVMARNMEAIRLMMTLQELANAQKEIAETKALLTSKAADVADKLRIGTMRTYVAEKLGLSKATMLVAESEEGETVAKTAGTVASRGRFTSQLLENGANSSSVVIRFAATAAQWALNAAMYAFPIIAIIAGVVALVTGFVKLVSWVNEVTGVSKVLTSVWDGLVGVLRNVASFMTGGLIDSKAVHEHIAAVKEMAKEYQKLSEETKNRIQLLEAEGANVLYINDLKKKQLEQERQSLQAKLEVAKADKEKKDIEELTTKLKENEVEMVKAEHETTMAIAETMKKQGATEVQILNAKIGAALAEAGKTKAAIQGLEVLEIQNKLTEEQEAKLKDLKAAYEGQIDGIRELNRERTAAQNKEAEERKKHYEEAKAKRAEAMKNQLESEKAAIQDRLLLAEAGSMDELTLQTQVKAKERDIALQNEKLTAEQRKLINDTYFKDVTDLTKKYWDGIAAVDLDKQKTIIETRLAEVSKGSAEELTLNKQLVALEEKQAIAGIDAKLKGTEAGAAKEALIHAQALVKQKKLDEDYYNARLAAELKAVDMELKVEEKKLQDELKDSRLTFEQQQELTLRLAKLKVDEAAKELETLTEYHKDGLISEEEYLKRKAELNDKYDKAAADKDAAILKAKEDGAEHNQKKIEEIYKGSFEIISSIGSAYYSGEQARLDASLKSKHITQQQYDKQMAALRLKQWKFEHDLKLIEGAENLAVAISKAVAQSPQTGGEPGTSIAIAIDAVQLGILAAQKAPAYAKGVELLKGPGTSTSDSILARLSAGERVVSADTNKDYFPALHAIHQRAISPVVANALLAGYGHQIPKTPLNVISPVVGIPIINEKALAKEIAKELSDSPKVSVSIDQHGFKVLQKRGATEIEYVGGRYDS